MAKKRVLKAQGEISLVEKILFGGTPRAKIGTAYVVETSRGGREFETRAAATKFFNVQVSLRPRPRNPDA
ncbi:MAG TPA: hypothetical protein VGF97_10890 [Rhizomicrobium sp.]|jgi:hypothetical protein